MADTGSQQDNNRRRERFETDRRAHLHDGERRRQGTVTDISASGAAMAFDLDDEDLAALDDLNTDSYVNLEIDDLSPIGGFVARNLDDGVAVAFDLDDYEEERFANEIASSVRGMALDD